MKGTKKNDKGYKEKQKVRNKEGERKTEWGRKGERKN